MLMWMGRYGRQNIVDIADRCTIQDLRNWVLILEGFLEKESTPK